MILWPCDFFVSAPPYAVFLTVRRPWYNVYGGRRMIRTTTAVQPFDGRRTLTLKAQKQYASAGKALTKKNSHYIKASERHSRKGISTAYKHRKSGRERDCSQHASAIRNRWEWSRRLQLSMTPRHPAKRVTWRWGQIRRRPTLEESPDPPPKCWRW